MKSPDINDTLQTEGEDAARARGDRARPYKGKLNGGVGQSAAVPLQILPGGKSENTKTKPSWKDEAMTGTMLHGKLFPPIRYVIPGMVTEGVNLLVSRPKLGKSWFLLQVGGAVALGNQAMTTDDDAAPDSGDVLALFLEDGLRRVQRRMTKHYGVQVECWPERMTIMQKWKRLDEGGIEDMREWCSEAKSPRLILIDTLAKVRPKANISKTGYTIDYEACEKLIQLCHEFPGLAIIVAHHDRKMDADDVFDTVSGTLGLTGGVDTIMILKREGHGVTLHIQGRDLENTVEKAVNFDKETCRWHILGDANEIVRSDAERKILDALRPAQAGMTPTELKEATGIKKGTVDGTLARLVTKGRVARAERGRYAIATTGFDVSL